MSNFQCPCGIPYQFAQYSIVERDYNDIPFDPTINNIFHATHLHIQCVPHAAFYGEPDNIVGCGRVTVVEQ